nr:uncharacterized protein LOC117855869 [Setaria viridis]
MSIATSRLVLALAGVLLVAMAGRCSGDDHGHRRELADGCQQSGTLRPDKGHSCDECCKAGKSYPTYRCSPPVVSGSTKAIMTLNDFDAGGDGGDPSKCDEKFHKNTERVVALSTGWYAGGKRCGKNVRINAKGKSVLAKVVDECDSLHGCDSEHAFQPPCRPNVVDASQAVWDALGITGDEVGEYGITWSDAMTIPNKATTLLSARKMSTTSLLVLALAGLLLVTFPSLCGGSAAHRLEKCHPSGTLQGPRTGHTCGECCKAGHFYPTYRCSPPVTRHTKAIMTLNDFDEGGDGGDKSECDGKYHKNTERVVALSTGWYHRGKRCHKHIQIHAKGRSVLAKVVDECDTLHGCDKPHAYQPPCRPNIVDASKAVWDALGITGEEVGEYPITWSDA